MGMVGGRVAMQRRNTGSTPGGKPKNGRHDEVLDDWLLGEADGEL